MRLAKAPRAALDFSLRLARAPLDAAIDFMPGSGSGPRAAAQRVVDAVDSATRSLLGLTSDGREMREPPSDSPPRPAPEARASARPTPEARGSARQRPAPRSPAPAPARQRPAPTPPAPAPARQRPAPSLPPPPSHEEIAARAFELYEHGVPGDAESHWRTAERELTAARDT